MQVVGGAAWLTDRMRAGDRIVSIDGRDLRGGSSLIDVKSMVCTGKERHKKGWREEGREGEGEREKRGRGREEIDRQKDRTRQDRERDRKGERK